LSDPKQAVDTSGQAEARRAAEEVHSILARLVETRSEVLQAVVEAIAAGLRAGKKVLVFGNGGSAAEAQHFVAELINGIESGGPALPAVALGADASSLTAVANDRGFAEVFARQVRALGVPGDVALALTASGRSPDIIEGLRSARAAGLVTVGLTGEYTADIAPLADLLLDVPSCLTPRIQEAHLFALHLIATRLEALLSPGRPRQAGRRKGP